MSKSHQFGLVLCTLSVSCTLSVGWRMGSDLGKGFIVMLLSCDLHMMQPLLIGQIVPPQGYLHF